MPSARNWIITSAILLHFTNANSQKIFFEQLTTSEGLPSDYVNCLFEDSKGHLWIGTDKGACRYDGRTFQYFSNDNGLPSNFVSCFAEDPSGNIWLGTLNSGICKYDGKSMTPLFVQKNLTADIFKIIFNQDSSFFILSWQNKKYNLYFFKNEKSPAQVFPDMAFIKIIKPGLFITGSVKQLYIIEIKNHEPVFRPLPHPETNLGFFLYWLAGERVIALKEKSFYEYNADDGVWKANKAFPADKVFPFPEWTDVKDAFIDGKEFFAATSNGLIYVDKENKQHFFNSENGLGTNFIKSFYKDSRNNFYITTYGAGIKLWPMRYLKEYKANGKVTSFFHSGQTTYITTNKSAYRLQASAKSLYEFKNIDGGSLTGIFKDQKNQLYLGTLNNFYKLPGENFLNAINAGPKSNYSFKDNSGTSGFLEFNKKVYISTYGDGIFEFDDNTIDTLDNKSDLPAPLIVESLVSLPNSFAALTYNSGLTIYDTAKGFISLSGKEGLLSNTVYSVFSDKENETWIGTQGGLNLSDGKKIIKTFIAKDGLIGTKVLCIFRDAQKRLWILSDKYLHLLESDKLRAIRSCPVLFDKKNSINRAGFNAAKNTLFIGITDAVLTVDMSKIIPDSVVNNPILVAIRKDSVLLSPGNEKKISISHPASKINFQFKQLFYSITSQQNLYYKLSGFDDDWKLLKDIDEVGYPRLSPGNYELIAKTINADGYESKEFNLITLEVLPPLWKRNWFLGTAIVILIGLLFYIGNFILRKKYKLKLAVLQEEYRLQLERERIARELHDNVGSQLTYLINRIDDDYQKLSKKEEAEKLGDVARGAMQELRETIWALDKKEVQWDDFQNKIRQLLRLHKTETHSVEFEWNVNNQRTLNPLEALNIYRIIQEALNNAEKYSNADFVKVSIANNKEQVYVEIKDNGKGFDINYVEKGYGLRNMKKRAEEMNAVLQIQSETGIGTNVKLHLT